MVGVPPDASYADRGGADRGCADRGGDQMDGRLIASAGHGMAAPAVYSLPLAFMCTEMASAMPVDGASVVFVNEAFGSTLGGHIGESGGGSWWNCHGKCKRFNLSIVCNWN